MGNIVDPGTTLTLSSGTGLTLSASGTVPATSLLDGAGTITGTGFTLLNLGTIAADQTSTVLSIDTGTLTNSGTISATKGTLVVQSSVVMTGLSGSTLGAGVWSASGSGKIEILTSQVVTDDATITLSGTNSAFLSGSGTPQPIENTLTAIGSGGALNLLGGRGFQAAGSLTLDGNVTLAGGTLAAPGTLTIGSKGDIVGFGGVADGTPVVDGGTIEASGGALTLPGAGSIGGLGTLQSDAGASLVMQAFGTYSQSIVNNGTIDAAFIFTGGNGILTFSGPYSGTGGFLIQGGTDTNNRAVLELPTGVSGNVTFDPNFGNLLLDVPSTFNGTVSGFGFNDKIVLAGIATASKIVLTGSVLNIENNLNSVLQTVTLNTSSINYSGDTFHVVENGGTTLATVTVTCFAAGTRIRTLTGDVPVERLALGDVVQTHFAGTAPVVWLGHRHVNCRRHPDPKTVWPVRVAAHAFGPGEPCRDLFLSPDHAVFVDDVLIPIKHLINGHTITRRPVDEVTYYHVELAEHDVLLADGLAAESYLENGDRAAFDNAGWLVSLHPNFSVRRWEALGCAPVAVTGAKLSAVRARLAACVPRPRPARRVRVSA